jgi:hypothetical protein
MNSKERHLLKSFFQSLADLSAELVERLSEAEGAQPTVSPAPVKVDVAKPAPEPVKAAPAPEPEEEVKSIADSDELPEIPRPTAYDLSDPTYPRARLEAFLKSRGYLEDQYKTLMRSDLVKKCQEVITQMNTVQPGVVKRGRGRPRKDGMPNRSQEQVELRDAATDIAAQMNALDQETKAAIGKLLNVDANDSTFGLLVSAAIAGDTHRVAPIIEAARAALVQPLIADEADLVIEAAEKQIEAEKVEAAEDDEEEAVVEPTPAPIPAEVVVQKSMPVATRAANTDVASLPQGGVVQQVLANAASKFGYKGKLLGYIANVELRTAGELLSTQLQKAASGEFGDAPADMVNSYLRSMAPVGEASCGGSCLKCPRGGGQLAICATLLDREVMHGGLELVRDGKIRVLMQPTGVGLSDSAAGYAKFEDVFEFGG